MSTAINTNVASLIVQRSLHANQSVMSTAMHRLSSGLRINTAGDDAAGLAVAERMTTQVRGYQQAFRNSSDAISLLHTAESGTTAITNNLQRLRELATQSANAPMSSMDRSALNAEIEEIKEEIQRVATQTKFNGKELLTGSFNGATFQVGANVGETLAISGIRNFRTDDFGTIIDRSGLPVIPDAPGVPKSISVRGITYPISGNSAGELVKSISALELEGIYAYVDPNDGSKLGVAYANMDEPGSDSVTLLNVSAANRTIRISPYSNESSVPLAPTLLQKTLSINGGAAVTVSADVAVAVSPSTLPKTITVNGGPAVQLPANLYDITLPATVSAFPKTVQLGAGGPVYSVAGSTLTDLVTSINDLNIPGVTASLQAGSIQVQNFNSAPLIANNFFNLGSSASIPPAAQTTAQWINGQALPNVSAKFENGALRVYNGNLTPVELANFSGDGSIDNVAHAAEVMTQSINALSIPGFSAYTSSNQLFISNWNNTDIFLSNFASDSSTLLITPSRKDVDDIEITSQQGANKAMMSADVALMQVSEARSRFGASTNRLEQLLATLQGTSERQVSARSRIMDAEFAVETATLTRAQILQQAGMAMLTKANWNPQNVLSLLKQ